MTKDTHYGFAIGDRVVLSESAKGLYEIHPDRVGKVIELNNDVIKVYWEELDYSYYHYLRDLEMLPDLTTLTTPFGLLDEKTQKDLKSHGGPYEIFMGGNRWITVEEPFTFKSTWVYRVAKGPQKMIEAIEKGELTAELCGAHGGFLGPYCNGTTITLLTPLRAYEGSLDAALALHEALLPGWTFDVTNGSAFVCGARASWGDGDFQFTGEADIHSRAWLLAILRGYQEK